MTTAYRTPLWVQAFREVFLPQAWQRLTIRTRAIR